MNKAIDFSRLASIYDFLGGIVFLGSLHRSQIHFLSRLQKIENVLIVGGGTGRFLVELLKLGKVEKLTYVDISAGMISQAKKKVQKIGALDKVDFICGGLDSIPDKEYDLICTHYFLDCFEEVELSGIMKKFKKLLSKEGVWHFTDFYLDSSSSIFRKCFVAFLYRFFKVFCGLKVKKLPNFKLLFLENGLQVEEEKYFFKCLLRTAIYR